MDGSQTLSFDRDAYINPFYRATPYVANSGRYLFSYIEFLEIVIQNGKVSNFFMVIEIKKMEMLIDIKNKDRKHTLDFMKNRVYSYATYATYALMMGIKGWPLNIYVFVQQLHYLVCLILLL